jgi:lipopolysaccharide/colanic/teichoic acid biosynthesis glycosyltransferase
MQAVVRLFDFLVSGLLLLVTAPIFAVVAILIKLDSNGPVFFLQERVGKDWRPFRMFKFRKMYERVGAQGPGVTARRDVRVTRVGAWLERTKLDELPQLLNVLLGHMSLVGPRPEIPRFTNVYRQKWDRVLAVKPGILGPNQITHRNEAELYPDECEDPEGFYVESILPGKLDVDAVYAARKSPWYDLWILVRGGWAVLAGMITRDTIRTQRWQVAYLLGSVLLGLVTLTAVMVLRLGWGGVSQHGRELLVGLGLMFFARLLAFYEFRVHRSIHVYFTLYDALRICGSVAAGTVLGIGFQFLANIRALPRVVFVLDAVLLIVVMITMSYLIDRVLGRLRQGRRFRIQDFAGTGAWGAAAGMTGSAAMFVGLRIAWPAAFGRAGSDAVWMLAAPFVARLVLFPMLLCEMRGAEGVVGAVTQRFRPVVGHVALVFVADITLMFFADVRDFSRLALILGEALYVLPVFGLLSVHAAFRNGSAEPEPAVAPPVQRSRALIVGEGRETALLIQAMKDARRNGSGVDVIGVAVENPMHRTRQIEGVEVVGTAVNLGLLIEARQPSVVVVLRNTVSGRTFRRVVRACRDARVDMRAVPGIEQFFAQPPRTTVRPHSETMTELVASGTDLR